LEFVQRECRLVPQGFLVGVQQLLQPGDSTTQPLQVMDEMVEELHGLLLQEYLLA
jgi:hypothetical protein